MNYILGGGGFASRLMKIVRSKNGLAYGISSGFDAGKFPGSFAVNTQTKNKSTNEALQLIVEQLRDIQEHPVSDAELASARKGVAMARSATHTFHTRHDFTPELGWATFKLVNELGRAGLPGGPRGETC